MAKLRYLVSLITKDNDYQMEQAASARSAAAELGIDAEVVLAENDAITQSMYFLRVIQVEALVRPNATAIVPPSCGRAIGLMTRAFQAKIQPDERTFITPEPFPPLESLKPLSGVTTIAGATGKPM